MKLKFGYVLLLEKYSVNQILKQTILADKYFNSMWVTDHFHPWVDSGGQASMAWPVMATVAERTKKNTSVSSYVTCPCMRYNPVIVAQTFATLSEIYPKRIALGVGSGEALNELPFIRKWPKPSERLEMLVEAIKIIRSLWKNNFVTFTGKFFQFKDVKLYTKPTYRIPIYFAASGPKACRLAGIYGDHWITGSSSEPKYIKEVAIPALEKGAREVERDPSQMEKVGLRILSFDEDYDKALKSDDLTAGLLPEVFQGEICDPRIIEKYVKAVPENLVNRKHIIATSPDEIIKDLERYIDAGCTTICLANVSPKIDETIQILGSEVFPALRN